MLRGAAKNFAHVVPLCRPDQYGRVLDEIRRTGDVSRDTRRRLAAEAFASTAAYEAAIASWFGDRESFPETLTLSYRKVTELAYGENPHQRAAFYADAARAATSSRASSSCTGRSCRSTTSTTSRRAPARCASSPSRHA